MHVSEYQQTRDTLSTATQQGLPTAFAEANVYIPYIISRYGRTCSSSSLQSPPWCASDIPSPDAPQISAFTLLFLQNLWQILHPIAVKPPRTYFNILVLPLIARFTSVDSVQSQMVSKSLDLTYFGIMDSWLIRIAPGEMNILTRCLDIASVCSVV